MVIESVRLLIWKILCSLPIVKFQIFLMDKTLFSSQVGNIFMAGSRKGEHQMHVPVSAKLGVNA